MIVDRPASNGALPLAVVRDTGCKVAYLPGLAMRRIANFYPGEVKTDAKDASVIADAAHTLPHALRSLELADEVTTELTILTGFDQDLGAVATRTSNRIRGLLTHFHPSLERALGPRLDHQAVTWLPEHHGSPADLRQVGHRHLVELIHPKAPRMAAWLIVGVFDAPDEQTVTVPGTGTLDIVVPSLARSLAAVHEQAWAPGSPDQRSAGGPPSFPGRDLDARRRSGPPQSRAWYISVLFTVFLKVNRFWVNAMSAISTKGRMRFMVFTESFTAETMCRFLDRLAGHFDHKVHLMVDGHSAHRSRKVRDWLAAHPDDVGLHSCRRTHPS